MHHLITALQQPPFWHHDGFGMGAHWGWWLFGLVILALAIWVVVISRRHGGSGAGGHGEGRTGGDAKEVLQRRFAEGELSEEEFRERLRVLRESE